MSNFLQPKFQLLLGFAIVSQLQLGCGELQSIDTVPIQLEVTSLIDPVMPNQTEPPVPPEPPLTDCLRQVQNQFLLQEAQKMNWYSNQGFPVPEMKRRSFLRFGVKPHMVVIAHGFVSDPTLQADVIQALLKEGYGVIAPLLTGFGSSAEAANASTLNDWQSSLNDAIALAQLCPQKVSLMGHSFGGALMGGTLVHNNSLDVESLIMLAPSFQTQAPFWQETFSGLLYFTEILSADNLGEMIGIDLYAAFQIDRPQAGGAGYSIPVRAAAAVTQYQDELFAETEGSSSVRSLLLLTSGDTIIRNDSATDYVNTHFTNATIHRLANSDLIVHSFQRRLINPFFDQMMVRIVSTLEGP